jgi:hypothetical protein
VVAVTRPLETPAGVELDRTEYVLRFEIPPLAGVVVAARKPTAGGLVDLTMAQAATGGLPDAAAAAAGDALAADALYRVFRAFAGALLSWNITDRGEPVPATLDGLLGLELEHAVGLTYTWLDRVGQAEQSAAATEAELDLPVRALG